MELHWIYEQEASQSIKSFLKQEQIPRKFISYVKFSGGSMIHNGQSVTVRSILSKGDTLTLVVPAEDGHDSVIPSFEPIEVVYEDRDVLVVNKPMNVVSIPSRLDPDSAMANRIRGYYVERHYENQVIHIVTRLDRDTTGLMLIAKHRLAHALLDRQLQDKTLIKRYRAISTRTDWNGHGIIDAPIARCDTSIITRQVGDNGQRALTEYWAEEVYSDSTLMRLQLHTGRTHQIRVHMQYCGGTLVGDDLYGGPIMAPLERQALHCSELEFVQPLTHNKITLYQPLPEDMQQWVDLRRRMD